jgi:hypothetical protein
MDAPVKVSGRQLASKWLKTNALRSNPAIAPHIPPTSLYSPAALRRMLDLYGSVVLKPVRGTGGLGVMKVARQGPRFVLRNLSRSRSLPTFESLRRAVDAERRGRAYLIQKDVRLATVAGRPIDYRVKVVKTAGGEWVFRSMVGRLARKGLFVTNLCRGGTMLKAAQGIRMSLSPSLVGVKKSQMRNLTRTATSLLESRFPGLTQLGYDYGIDRNGQIWILEVNTRPH